MTAGVAPAPSGYITRTTLSLDPLDLWTPGDAPADQSIPRFALVLDGLEPGGIVKRRQIAESNYVDDAFQVQSSKARIPASYTFMVSGYTVDNLQDNLTEILAAVDQPHWNLVVQMDSDTGSKWGWRCWDAEVTPGFAVPTWYGVYLILVVSTLRSPVPVFGPI